MNKKYLVVLIRCLPWFRGVWCGRVRAWRSCSRGWRRSRRPRAPAGSQSTSAPCRHGGPETKKVWNLKVWFLSFPFWVRFPPPRKFIQISKFNKCNREIVFANGDERGQFLQPLNFGKLSGSFSYFKAFKCMRETNACTCVLCIPRFSLSAFQCEVHCINKR